MHRTPHKLSLAAAVAALLGACLGLAACSQDSAPKLTASAQQLAAKKDYTGAAIQYKAALQLEPNSADLRRSLGRALLDGGDPPGAIVEFKRALDLKAPEETVAPDLARALLLTGDYDKLTRQYGKTVLTDMAAQAALMSTLAQAWAALHDKARAQASVDAALQAQPGFGRALIIKAGLMATRREYGPALAIVDGVLAKEPELYEGWLLKGEILTAAQGDKQAARDCYLKALSIEPSYVPAHAAVITAALAAGDLTAAKAQAAKLHALLPNHPQTAYIDALIAYNEKDVPRARELIQQVIKLIPDNVLVLQMAGVVEAQMGSLAAAQTYLARVVAIDPDQQGARVNLARVYLATGQASKCMETLQPLLSDASGSADAYALAGDAALRLGDAVAARNWYTRASRSNPDDVRSKTSMLLTNLGPTDASGTFAELTALADKSKDSYPDLILISTRLSRSEFPEALAALDKLAKKEAESARTLAIRGRILLAMRDYAGARTAFEKALQLDPKYFAATSDLAELDMRDNKPDAARKRIEASIAADPANFYARMQLANYRMLANAPVDEVQKILVEATRTSPGAAEPRLKLVDYLLRKRQFKEALAVAEEAGAALSNDASVIEVVGRTQMEAGSPERAISTFGKLASLVPGSAVPHLRLAAVYRALGKPDLTEAALKTALEVDPANLQAQKGLMSFLTSSGRGKDALAYAHNVQQKHPDRPEGYTMEATMLLDQSATDAAVEVLRKGLDKAKVGAPIASMLYATLVNSGKYPEAEKFATNRIKLHPDELGLQVDMGAAAGTHGDLDRAESLLTQVLAKQPNNAIALNNLAWALVQRKKAGATGYAQRANDLFPNQPNVMDTLAQALLLDKRVDEALAQQKKAVDLAPTDNALRLNLARIAVQAGDKALAKTELERLRKLGAAFPKQDAVTELTKAL